MADYVPFVYQTKSAILALCGDTQGARNTQHNFTRTFPGISHARGCVELMMGKKTEAKETFRLGGAVIDAIPVVGHAKGVIHYIAGDKEGGDAAMISSSRTTGVIGGAVGGFVLAGPPGAVAGGVAGGVVMDSVTTLVDSAIHGEGRSHGTLNVVDNICNNPKDVWNYVDLVVVPAMDGLAGYTTGKGVAKVGRPGIRAVKALKTAGKTVAEATAYEERANFIEKKLQSPDSGDVCKNGQDEASADAVADGKKGQDEASVAAVVHMP